MHDVLMMLVVQSDQGSLSWPHPGVEYRFLTKDLMMNIITSSLNRPDFRKEGNTIHQISAKIYILDIYT